MIPKSHPRYESLLLRYKIVKAAEKGYLADSGMIAHGRGEAFDYLIGEKTTYPAKRAMYVAVAALLLSNNPVISTSQPVSSYISLKSSFATLYFEEYPVYENRLQSNLLSHTLINDISQTTQMFLHPWHLIPVS